VHYIIGPGVQYPVAHHRAPGVLLLWALEMRYIHACLDVHLQLVEQPLEHVLTGRVCQTNGEMQAGLVEWTGHVPPASWYVERPAILEHSVPHRNPRRARCCLDVLVVRMGAR